jgi:putative colanic acid biosysnthesis UDP-glucose lipid carrier transferase
MPDTVESTHTLYAAQPIANSGEKKAAQMNNPLVARSICKRILDVAVASMALAFLLPVFLIVAAMITIESKGGVFFLQRRTGLNGKIFQIYKFRSMRVAEDGDKVVQAKQNDDRVTMVGRFIRKTSIDELPQLLNVLKGDMSLVGPRPHALAHDGEFASKVPAYQSRFQARPGLTGLAAIRGYRGEIKTHACIEGRVNADNEYIESWSIWSDVMIIAKTVPMIFRDKNAY